MRRIVVDQTKKVKSVGTISDGKEGLRSGFALIELGVVFGVTLLEFLNASG